MKKQIICKKCGEQVPLGMKICPKCGLKVKKPFYKRVWFIVLVVFLVFGILGSIGGNDTSSKTESVDSNSSEDTLNNVEYPKQLGKDDHVIFYETVRDDTTNNWRMAQIVTTETIDELIQEYYDGFFKDDNEIHAVINFTLKTTTRISKVGNMLILSSYEYVDGEEHSAKTLFSGLALGEKTYNLDTHSYDNYDDTISNNSEEVTDEKFLDAVKLAIDGDLASEDEQYTDITISNKELIIGVDISKADSPFGLDLLAITRAQGITEDILSLPTNYDVLWDAITVDFGEEGSITCTKADIQGTGSLRYFDFPDDRLKK